MNNEPVAWTTKFPKTVQDFSFYQTQIYTEPLYTHPVKAQKCVVKDCENHKHEGSFNGDVCSPCYQFIVHGKGIHSQAYRNTHPVKEHFEDEPQAEELHEIMHSNAELTDEEIYRLLADSIWAVGLNTDCLDEQNWADGITVARAILLKAQEK